MAGADKADRSPHWVSVDESGETTEMTRRYGRAPRGERVREAAPADRWSTLTLQEAMRREGGYFDPNLTHEGGRRRVFA